jgi:hypothetical protein
MMLFGFLAMAIAIIKFSPETRSARWLHRHLVDFPLDLAARASRRQILAYAILIMLLLGLQELALLAPADLLVAYAFDVATLVDLTITVWTFAAVTRVKGAARATLGRLPLRRGLRIGMRRKRRRVVSGSGKPANDDEEEAARPMVRAA